MAVAIKPGRADPETYLRVLYKRTEQSIINEIFRKRGKGYVDYAEVTALERIQNTLQGMVDESYQYVPQMIEKRYDGVVPAGYRNARGLTSVTNRQLMEMLTDNLLGEIIEASQTAYQTSRKLYALARLDEDAYRKAMLETTLYTEALGKGAALSSKLMEATVRSEGITGFVDKSGRRWSLNAYCNMATRTTARQAEVAGVLEKDTEHDLYRIVPHVSSCGLCAPLQGRVYSKSGENPNYPPLSVAFGKIDPNGGDDLSNTYLNIHPNCLCTLVPWTEAGKTEAQLKRIREFSDPKTNPLTKDPRSKKQIEAYRLKEKNRREKLAELRKKQAEKVAKAMPQTEEGHKGMNRAVEIARSRIDSPDYGRRISGLGESGEISKIIRDEARKMLNHRNGTLKEDLMFLAPDGKYKTRTDYNKDGEVLPNAKQIAFFDRYPEYSMIVMHNHPQSTVPSPIDIQTAYDRKYKYGVIVGHDGSIIKYQPTAQYKGYMYYSAIAKLELGGYTEDAFNVFIKDCLEAGVEIELL